MTLFGVYDILLYGMVELILKQLLQRLPKRSQEVLSRRAGLKNNRPETLEAIGQYLGITRERVRQIEEAAYRQMRNGLPAESHDFVASVARYLNNFGGIRAEEAALEELTFLLNDRHPAAKARIRFLIELSGAFSYFSETPKHSAFWATSQELGGLVLKFLDAAARDLKKKKSPIGVDEIEALAKRSAAPALARAGGGALVTMLSLSREMALNPFGEFGLTAWPEIVPSGVRDRAFRILRRAGKPLHFRDLARELNAHAAVAATFHPAWQKQIETQTVHNELIKDSNFVLVGRGLYGLREWGYEAGTVKDILVSLMRKAKKPLTKAELVSGVKAQRMVQENTILINLQDRKVFTRLPDGRYRIARKWSGLQREA